MKEIMVIYKHRQRTQLKQIYPAAGIVRATYKKSSVVSVKLKNGVIFEFYAEDVKDWRKGDLCAMIIDNNGTKAIYDDMVIDAVNMDQE